MLGRSASALASAAQSSPPSRPPSAAARRATSVCRATMGSSPAPRPTMRRVPRWRARASPARSCCSAPPGNRDRARIELARGAVPMRGDDDLSNVFWIGSGRRVWMLVLPFLSTDVKILAINEHHDIGVLLDTARLAKVAEHGNVRLPGLDCTREL